MKKTLDWNKYLELAAKAVGEGIVMLKNDNNALPLNTEAEVSVFGRIQLHYYKSGTGSGGMVNVSKVVGITDGLIEAGVNVNKELLGIYKKWDEENPMNYGEGFGTEPWSQDEMPLSDETAAKAAERSNTAIVVIGRTAGEEMDNKPDKGSYYLSGAEEDMLRTVRKNFKKVIVLLNTAGIIDMGFVDEFSPDAVLYVWHGGMNGGAGTADVLTGKVSPSGKLADTIAYQIGDYPSDGYFGGVERNFYGEDIYVGYRYFETFEKEKVRYPFGFGLSYTSFEISGRGVIGDFENGIRVFADIKNTGLRSGKEVLQVYCESPQGNLGKPSRVLCGYAKTRELAPKDSQHIEISVDFTDISSYDDSGVSGERFCRVLEAGEYRFYTGTDVRSAAYSGFVNIRNTKVLERLKQACAPVLPFKRIINKGGKIGFEDVPLSEVDEQSRRLSALPEETLYTGDKGIKLTDVYFGKNTLREFIAQLSDEDLSCIVRGEGMGSPKVTAGTAAAFGGVSKSLSEKGVPCGCCSDGPSGMRLDCGTKAFSLPGGTLLACTFNTELNSALFAMLGLEMENNKVDCLLGPGINIHRHPLNGRNFEYFSEDPFLTGTIAAAQLKGLHTAGVTGTIKHFCGNNQETYRHTIDSVISERALREIYLRGFEIAIKQGGAKTVMTTYGQVNGLWTAGSFDLNTSVLRGEWGFKGFVMTDWWAAINRRGREPDMKDFAAMVMAQNDVYMVCADGENHDDNTLECLKNGSLKRGELQRSAENILRVLLGTHAMRRLAGDDDTVEIIGQENDSQDDADEKDVEFYKVDKEFTLDLKNVKAKKGLNYVFALDISNFGKYEVTVSAASNLSELAQTAMTIFTLGTPAATFTWNGTGGKFVEKSRELPLFSRFSTIRLYFASDGLELDSISFKFIYGDYNR